MMRPVRQPQLLVSVRSEDEALAALAGAAQLVDVKEPSRGPLGAADVEVISSVVQAVAGRVPVSVALGEWADYSPVRLPEGISFAKWGLSRTSRAALGDIRETTGPVPVLVAYADHERARSPSPEEIVEAACQLSFRVVLIDTFQKDGSNLLDWLSVEELMAIRHRLEVAGTALALAGSINESLIELLVDVGPAWFAVRGAACDGGRGGRISTQRVRRLREVIERMPIPTAAD
jgi:uncharacterized protein (UPF0264 family)